MEVDLKYQNVNTPKLKPEIDISDMNKMKDMCQDITGKVKTLGVELGNIQQDEYYRGIIDFVPQSNAMLEIQKRQNLKYFNPQNTNFDNVKQKLNVFNAVQIEAKLIQSNKNQKRTLKKIESLPYLSNLKENKKFDKEVLKNRISEFQKPKDQISSDINYTGQAVKKLKSILLKDSQLIKDQVGIVKTVSDQEKTKTKDTDDQQGFNKMIPIESQKSIQKQDFIPNNDSIHNENSSESNLQSKNFKESIVKNSFSSNLPVIYEKNNNSNLNLSEDKSNTPISNRISNPSNKDSTNIKSIMQAKSQDNKNQGKEGFFVDLTPTKIDLDSNKYNPSIDNELKLKKLFSTSMSTGFSLNRHLSSSKFYSVQLDNEIKEANESDIIQNKNLNDKFVVIDKNTISRTKFNNSKSTGVLPQLERSSGIQASYAGDNDKLKDKFADKYRLQRRINLKLDKMLKTNICYRNFGSLFKKFYKSMLDKDVFTKEQNQIRAFSLAEVEYNLRMDRVKLKKQKYKTEITDEFNDCFKEHSKNQEFDEFVKKFIDKDMTDDKSENKIKSFDRYLFMKSPWNILKMKNQRNDEEMKSLKRFLTNDEIKGKFQ